MTTLRCPTCGRPRPGGDPFTQTVTGAATPADAPKLHAAWAAIRLAVEAHPGIARIDLCRRLEAAGICAAPTAEHLTRAAVQLGQLTRTYQQSGTPARRRTHLWPTEGTR